MYTVYVTIILTSVCVEEVSKNNISLLDTYTGLYVAL